MSKSILQFTCTASLLLVTGLAQAARPGDLATKWPVNDDNPSANIPTVEERNRNPLEFGYFLQDLIARANTAYAAHNWGDAVKYYEAMAKAVPDVATGFSHLCVAYAKLERQDVALANCAKATTLQGAKVFDHLHYLDLLLRKQELTETDVESANASLQHLREHAARNAPAAPGANPQAASSENDLIAKVREEIQQRRQERERGAAGAPSAAEDPSATATQPAAPPVPPEPVMPQGERDDAAAQPPGRHLPTEIELLACKLAARTGNEQGLTTCIAALREYKANERLLLPFLWAQALSHQDQDRADQLMKDAAGYGLPEATLASMQKEQDAVFGSFRRIWKYLVASVVLIGVGIGLYVSLRQKLRRPVPSQPQSVSTEA